MPRVPPFPLMFALALSIAIPGLLGTLATHLLLRGSRPLGPGERWCWGFPLGMGFLSMEMFLLGLLGIPFTLASTAGPLVAATLVLAGLIWKTAEPAEPSPSTSLPAGFSAYSREKQLFILILAIWLLLKLTSVFAANHLRPLWVIDSISNWGATAKVFYYEKGLQLDVPTPFFFGREVIDRKLGYPLHNPLMQVWTALCLGEFDDVWVKFWSPFFLVAAAGLLLLFARERLGLLRALVFVVLFLSSPLMSYHATEVNSDFLLGVYVFLAGLACHRYLEGRRGYLPLIGLNLGMAMFTKVEGAILALGMALPLGIHLVFRRAEPGSGKDGICLLLSLLYIAPWYAFKSWFGLDAGNETITWTLGFFPEAGRHILIWVLSLANFNLFLVAFPIFLLLNGRPTRGEAMLLLPLGFYAAFLGTLYITVPDYFQSLHRGEIFFRNVLTVYPLLVLLTVLFFGKDRTHHS